MPRERYRIVLLDDDDHSFNFVVNVLFAVLGYTAEEGFRLALEAHQTGRAVICTAPLARALHVKDEIEHQGMDPAVPHCTGPLQVLVERVVEGEEPPAPPAPPPGPAYVVVFADEEHGLQYVVDVLHRVLGCSETQALGLARKIDREGRAVVCTAPRPRALRVKEQIESYGPDPAVQYSRGPLRVVLEPV